MFPWYPSITEEGDLQNQDTGCLQAVVNPQMVSNSEKKFLLLIFNYGNLDTTFNWSH